MENIEANKAVETVETTNAQAVDSVPICLPCPFCGSKVGYVARLAGLYRVACDDCDIYGPGGSNYDEARARWNARATTPYRDPNLS
jgi:hypothetical protein